MSYPGIPQLGPPTFQTRQDAYHRSMQNRNYPPVLGTTKNSPGSTIQPSRQYYPSTNQQVYDYSTCSTSQVDDPARIYSTTKPRRGTVDWVKYCTAKYRSFNASTGLYRTKGGEYRPCT